MRKIFFVVAFLLAGCTTTQSVMESWLGHEESQLLAQWGAPDKVYTTSDGKKFVEWVTQYVEGGSLITCRQTFTIEDSEIVAFSHQGCPYIVWR